MSSTRIIILAGGKGTRMKSELPKPLIRLNGETLLSRLLTSVKAANIDPHPIVVAGYRHDLITAEVGDRASVVIQTEQRGTGHATAVGMEEVGDATQVIVLYADHPFTSAQTLQHLIKTHEANHNTLTLFTTTIPSYDGWYIAFERWGRIVRSPEGVIQKIVEYKDATPEIRAIKEVNPAICCFDAKWLKNVLPRLTNQNMQNEFYLVDTIELAMRDGQKIGSASIPPEETIGINSPEELAIAEALLQKQHKT